MEAAEIYRRASGRRRYNARRKLAASLRRQRIATLLKSRPWVRGIQTALAIELGVSQATLSRDVKAVLGDAARCRCCGQLLPQFNIIERFEDVT